MTVDEETSELVAQLRRRGRWLAALAAVRAELLSGGTVADALELIAERCVLLSDADAAVILLADDDGRTTVHAQAGDLTGSVVGLESQTIDGAWLAEIESAMGIRRVEDFSAPGAGPVLQLWQQVDSLLVAPIPVRGIRAGAVLCLRRAGRAAFDPESEPEIVGLAEQASIALEVAGREKQRRLAELMADRERIARDLHDHVIQRLFAVGLALEAHLKNIVDARVRERTDWAVSEIDEAIADLRASIFDLRGSGENRQGFRRRLGDIVTGVRDHDGGPRMALRCRGPVDTVVGPELADDALAVVREGVSNAVKHARATAVSVTVAATDYLTIVITDNGNGIPPGAVRSGLKNLAERAAANGGSLDVESVTRGDDTPAGATTGTTVSWTVPL